MLAQRIDRLRAPEGGLIQGKSKQEGRKTLNTKNWRQLLSFALSIVILLSCLCINVYAVETSDLDEDQIRQQIANKKASLEQQYGVKIVILNATSDDFSYNLGPGNHEDIANQYNSPAYQLQFLFSLEDAIQTIPSQLYAATRAKLAAQGKTLTIQLKPADARGIGGLYDPQTVTILLINGNSSAFAHEYGHMLHLTLLNAQYGAGALENDWTALNQGVAYRDYDREEKIFLTAYASTNYLEDFAESVRYLLADNQEAQSLSAQAPDCAAVNKVVFLRQLLCDAFSVDEAIFPDIYPSQPSQWAASGVQQYLELFPYETPLASATEPFYPGYQSGATREAFAAGAYVVAKAVLADGQSIGGWWPDFWSEVYPEYTRDKLEELNPFTDLGEIYNGANETIVKLYVMGVLNGTSATTFSPEGQITRQEAAVMLYRLCTALGYPFPKNAEHTFNDADQIADWAKESVEAVSAAGIMSGIGNNAFGPQQIYSYEQSALTMVRIYDLLSKQ